MATYVREKLKLTDRYRNRPFTCQPKSYCSKQERVFTSSSVTYSGYTATTSATAKPLKYDKEKFKNRMLLCSNIILLIHFDCQKSKGFEDELTNVCLCLAL